jgi:acyl-CoA hydrolase
MQIIPGSRIDISAFIRKNDHIVWGQATGEPLTLTEALAAQRDRVAPISAFLGSSFSSTFGPDHSDHIRFSSFGAVGTARLLSKCGVLSIIPCHVSQVAQYIRSGTIACDVAFVQVSPPDSNGRHSFGVVNDYIKAAVERARVVVAEINDRVPYTYSDTYLAGDEIDYAVMSSRPIVEVPPAQIGAIEEAIGLHCAEFIEDGSVLQIGIGAIPDAVLRTISDRRNLGIHSGSIGDGLIDLIRRGVVTNASKPIDPGVSITGALIGTHRLYDFAHRNNAISMRPTHYTHDGGILAQIPKLVTINSAIEVDLTGQVNAEKAVSEYIGATGGQGDFQRAGHRSIGGHAIVALPATAKGNLSRIVTKLSGPVTISRNDSDIVVTEFGSAQLKGQPLKERVKRMIAISHPDFRDHLETAALTLFHRGFD